MKKSPSKGLEASVLNCRQIDWELRPGGMLVQKREVGDGSSGPMIKIKVSHGSYHYEVTVPAQSTFGDLKKVLVHEAGLEAEEQRLLFRGKEKEDNECLHMEGVKDLSKVILLEDPACKERKLEEMKKNEAILKACEAVARVRAEVDKLSQKVVTLETTVSSGTLVAEKEFIVLTELLMVQLLKLDMIEADGEAKVQRRIEVRRVQSFVDALDKLKARNSNTLSNSSNEVSVTAKWETFDSGVGSVSTPVSIQSATKVTQDWELFD
ncbi:BAG family molecular chaperone regulator 4 [Ricinus communis]|uniref:Protein binding protein, putative n=1 Tax=Ricinus communis TaxID=3988 RepID=B9RSC6_RICCO|nr:BAG family molecular chaperone regulator 4 [Ricinus communis]EEF45740.1 protein binding protein, putative [Ricinus communis]|eukprot:XP_002516645.1 BAG family molecular chaperone regulator 4 [Ricinus communis]